MIKLKREIALAVAGLLLTMFFAVSAGAAPAAVNYQGRLVDKDSGAALTGTIPLEFRIYDAETGGTLLWSESQSAALEDSGVFQVVLGSAVPLDADLFAEDDCWLEVWVGGEQMNSRQKFAAVPFALQAEEAVNAATLGTYGSAAFVRKTEAGVVNSQMVLDNALTAADLAPNSVGASELADNTVGSAAIVNGSIMAADLHDGAALAEILDDDGPGSGLNADLLDGHDTTAFASASHSHNFSALQGSIDDSQIPAGITRDAELDARVVALENRIAALETTVAQLASLLQGVTRENNDLTFSGMNVHIVSGSGSTYAAVNGLGNLVVGYNEKRGNDEDNRTGSHNIIVGRRHNFSSYGGFVSGYENDLYGTYCTVSGGHNLATGSRSTISGGRDNETRGDYSSITGGAHNIASGYAAFVGGGGGNEASKANEAFANYSTVVGGQHNTAGYKDGGSHETGQNAVVSGGFNNSAIEIYSSVSGGSGNKASGSGASVSGGYNNEASGYNASVSGGNENHASNASTSISGGRENTAAGNNASVSGGMFNTANGNESSISGGYSNDVWGTCTTVTGGRDNYAGDMYSSVSGGFERSSTGEYDWRAGGYFQTQ